jgi:hypothetical protein
MKVSDLSGADLDYWVAKAHGWYEWENWMDTDNPDYDGEFPMFAKFPDYIAYYEEDGDATSYHIFHNDWGDAGPIIERERINTSWSELEDGGCYSWKEGWHSRVMWGKTPLESSMRCYVASVFGEEVDEKEINS